MKTPKRHYELTTMAHSAWSRVYDRPQEEVSAARWKRKNLIKQLKRTIQKFKDGTMLPEVEPLRLAYKWLQELKKPKADAPVQYWRIYMSQMKCLQTQMNKAVDEAAICLGIAIEKQDRKEQK